MLPDRCPFHPIYDALHPPGRSKEQTKAQEPAAVPLASPISSSGTAYSVGSVAELTWAGSRQTTVAQGLQEENARCWRPGKVACDLVQVVVRGVVAAGSPPRRRTWSFHPRPPPIYHLFHRRRRIRHRSAQTITTSRPLSERTAPPRTPRRSAHPRGGWIGYQNPAYSLLAKVYAQVARFGGIVTKGAAPEHTAKPGVDLDPDTRCRNCGKPGHLHRECTEPSLVEFAGGSRRFTGKTAAGHNHRRHGGRGARPAPPRAELQTGSPADGWHRLRQDHLG